MSSSNTLKKRIFSDYIQPNTLSVGKKLPTVKDLASQYSVSIPTLSKAVEILASEGWLTKRRGSGLYVGSGAEGFEPQARREHRKRIGYIASNLRLPLGHNLLEGVEKVVRRQNAALEVANSQWQIDEERRQLEMMQKEGVDGVVLYPNGRTDQYEYLETEFRDLPIVVADLYQPTMHRPHIVFDNISAGRQMTQYLLAKGRKHIAFLRFGTLSLASVNERVEGYRRALAEAGIASRPELIAEFDGSGECFTDKINVALDQLLAVTPRPDAVIMPYDVVVPAGIHHLRAKGIRVPEDIIMAGFDNIQGDQVEHWPTTSPDFVRMGEMAADILFERIETRNFEVSKSILPCPLVVPEQAGAGRLEILDKGLVRLKSVAV